MNSTKTDWKLKSKVFSWLGACANLLLLSNKLQTNLIVGDAGDTAGDAAGDADAGGDGEA